MNSCLSDIRFAARLLFKDLGFTFVVLLILSLGTCATTATFTVVNAFLIRPLPCSEPDKLVHLWEETLPAGWGSVSYLNFEDWQKQNKTFAGIASYLEESFTFKSDRNPERVEGASVSPNFFNVFGIQPLRGRAFLVDDANESRQVAVISERLWRNQLGSDPEMPGKDIWLDGTRYRVIGVVPARYGAVLGEQQLWTLLIPTPAMKEDRSLHRLTVIGRIKKGMTLSQARQDMTEVGRALASEYAQNARRNVRVVPLREDIVQPVKQTLLVLLAAVACAFLIVLANLSSLMLVRSTLRQREIAIRTILGASRPRLVRQFLVEALMLTAIGSALGWVLALLSMRLLAVIGPQELPSKMEFQPDMQVLLFSVAVSLLMAGTLAIVMVVRTTHRSVAANIQSGVGLKVDRGGSRIRGLIVAFQIAIAMALLSGTGLMVHSLLRLQQINPGFSPNNVLTFRIALPKEKYADSFRVAHFYNSVSERINTLAGVEAAGFISFLPAEISGYSGDFEIEGREQLPRGRGDAEKRAVGGSYYQAMKVPIIRGRDFTDSDIHGKEPVCIINQTLARLYFAGENPIGRRIQLSRPPWRTIVGVVGDVRQEGLDSEIKPQIDFPYTQYEAGVYTQAMSLVVHTRSNPIPFTDTVRSVIQAVDPDQPVFNVDLMENILARSIGQRRFVMYLIGLFGTVAVLLAMIGIYGQLAYLVRQRTQEIGLRMALGATRIEIFGLVLKRGMLISLSGLAAGVLGSFLLGRFLSTFLYDVKPLDFSIHAFVSLLLLGLAFLASYVPSRRAAKLDPTAALKYN